MARQRHARHGHRAGGDLTSLPALSSLEGVPGFDRLGATAGQREAFREACERLAREEEADPAEYELGCVVRLDRGFPAVVTSTRLARAEWAADLTKGGEGKVAVGDWVCLRCPTGHDKPLIEQILPRRSAIARWRGGARGERQTLAANVDVVLVAQALGPRPVACDRLARSAVVARDCGSRVAVVLTKADRCGGAERLAQDVGRVRAVLGDDVPVVATSSLGSRDDARALDAAARGAGATWGIDAVRALVPAGVVAMVLGESGAGKSTLLNALLGRDLLRTGAVRSSDDAGRHTTVSRRMVSVPGGGIIVDMPGLRSLPLVGHERGLALVFPDIAAEARSCRFRDCTHTHEPGCAVRAAYERGAFGSERLEAYLALAAEMRASAATLDPDVVI